MDERVAAEEQLAKLHKVLEVARRNGNAFFIENIEKEIAALEAGETSPIVQDCVINNQLDQSLGGGQ